MNPEKLILDPQDKTELHAQKEIEKQKKLVGRITPHRGHTLFEINCTTGEITEAEYEVEAIDFKAAANGQMAKTKKVITKENCLYISCLNKTNAKKKFLNYVMQNIKY